MKKILISLILMIILTFSSVGNCGLIGMAQRASINDKLNKLIQVLEKQNMHPYVCFATIKCGGETISINVFEIISFKTIYNSTTQRIEFYLRSGTVNCNKYKQQDLYNFQKQVEQCQEKYLKINKEN